MAVCPNCQVELAEGSRSCPLCKAPVREDAGRSGADSPYPERAIDPEGFEGLGALSKAQKRKIFIEVYTVCSLIVAFVVAAVDLFADEGGFLSFSWSLIPVATLALAWLSVCIPLLLARRPGLILAALAPALLGYVFLIDVLDGGGIGWFPTLGAPIAGLAVAAVVVSAVLGTVTRRKGLNVIAIALVAGAALGSGVELLLGLHFTGKPAFSWSAVVDIAVVPVAGFLFYLHYRITRRASLRKLFHL